MIRFTPRCNSSAAPLAGLPGWLSSMLRARGVETEEDARHFLSPDLNLLEDPFRLQDMDKAVRLIRSAVSRRDPVMIFGDYDADGVCATSILLETLVEEGARVSFRLPSRQKDGYGLNASAVREIAEKAKLLITVDCGISNHAEVALAKSLGLTVIVTDHHRLPETLPEADAVLNPLLGSYPSPFLCGAGVALKICQALQGLSGAEKRLDVAALATVADVVPLLGENRIIVREGLRRMEQTPRPGLRALLEVSGTRAPLRADHLAFRLAPRLNAAGRLQDAALGVQLLLTGKEEKARATAKQLEDLNRFRQDSEKEITSAALRLLAEHPSFPEERLILVTGEGWNPGLLGLAAGRLCERYHLPSVILTRQGEEATGSCRSIPGVDIFRLLSTCSDLLVRFGGHEQAAGLTVRTEKIPALRERLIRMLRETCPADAFVLRQEYDLSPPFSLWTRKTLQLLDLLEPTGCGNPPPLFLLSGAEIRSARRVGRDGSHLKLSLLNSENMLVDAVAFSQGDWADRDVHSLDVLYCPVLNEYGGRTSIEAQISAIREAEGNEEFIMHNA